MSTFDPAAFDRWLTTQPDDSIERGKLEDDLRAKIANMFDEVNVVLPEHVMDTAVTYAADLAEAYVTEVTVTCEKCGREINEETSAKDRVDPAILTCAPGFGCNQPDEPEPSYEPDLDLGPSITVLAEVPTDYMLMLLAGVGSLLRRDDKRRAKGRKPSLSDYHRFVCEDILDRAKTGATLWHTAGE